MEDKHIAA
uniref:Uncharacterized protein n=1 Tax=Rhizophora mucronata TaxID=61149 RepID=A0A2P2NEH5_RHIMU